MIDIREIKAEIHWKMPNSDLDLMVQSEPDKISEIEFLALAPRWAKLGKLKEFTV